MVMGSAAARKGSKTVSRPRRRAPRKQVRQTSWLDRLLQSLPFTQVDVQRFLTWGILALLFMAALLVANWFGVPQAAYRQVGAMTAKAGFEVREIDVVGLRKVDQMKVYDMVLDHSNKPLLLVDIDRIQRDLSGYGWIKQVRVSRQLPDKLFIEIGERKPVAVWQNGGNYKLLDDQGKVLDSISEAEIGNMPIVNGPNANKHLVSLEELLENAQSLKSQVAGATWVGNRRWDIRFKSGETLALPEGEQLAAQALINFTRMDGIHRLLGRNIIHFDLRDPDRMYMRKAPREKPAEMKATPAAPKKATQAEGSA
jgi:cell division protein FtsQ